MWMASIIAVVIFALIGGGISLLFKRQTLVEISNSDDEKFYEEVARELQERPLIPGLWTKAFAEMGGDDAKARALYINLRVEQLRDEAVTENERQKSEAKRKEKEGYLAAEAAKPPLKWYELLANMILGFFCGLVGLLFASLIIACLSDTDRANSGMSIVETFILGIFLGALAFAFGFIAYKCAKSVLR